MPIYYIRYFMPKTGRVYDDVADCIECERVLVRSRLREPDMIALVMPVDTTGKEAPFLVFPREKPSHDSRPTT